MAFKKLKKGRLSDKQVDLANAIRSGLVKRYPWGMSQTEADRTLDKIRALTSALFYIENKQLLLNNNILLALSRFEEKNYQRRAGFMTR
ncbi:hypothetical protein CU052_13330 [Vibrio harveyi]|uniref:hypothetical protein n=1 Tax=Vibrio harveyi TaxID=669 RepID=UPI000C7A6A55|nr:hypothetical protein [Vibrio harveyi]AWB00215.1 hypothetical protein CU052_13330 [Vibrio harveyi]HDM8061668.1 hypothetical protein [Vibrio harveyi]